MSKNCRNSGVNLKLIILAIFISATLFGNVSADEHSGIDFKSIKNACEGNYESGDCQKRLNEANEYCRSNKNDRHCDKLHKKMHLRSKMHQCKSNPDSEQCKKFKAKMQRHCEVKPESKPCKKYQAAMICKDSPDSDECEAAKQKAKDARSGSY